MDFNLIDILIHTDIFLKQMVLVYGNWIYALLFLVIFCETGLVVMPFLPGDSLLFVAGAVAATGGMSPLVVGGVLFAAAVLGDSCNYLIGHLLGEKLFSNRESKIFRRDYLERTHAFFERHGGKTVTLARFLPIIRTFAPFVAGVGEMPYLRFLAFSVTGSVLWIGGLLTLGFVFGNVHFVQKNLSILIIVVVGISFLPMVVQILRQRLFARKTA